MKNTELICVQFIVKKQYKTYKKGTSFRFKAIESEEEFTNYANFLKGMMQEFKEKYQK